MVIVYVLRFLPAFHYIGLANKFGAIFHATLLKFLILRLSPQEFCNLKRNIILPFYI